MMNVQNLVTILVRGSKFFPMALFSGKPKRSTMFGQIRPRLAIIGQFPIRKMANDRDPNGLINLINGKQNAGMCWKIFKLIFGKSVSEIKAIAIMSDTDQTGAKAQAWFDDIWFSD